MNVPLRAALKRPLLIAVVLTTVVASAWIQLGAAPDASGAVDPSGEFTAVAPVRLLDTRIGVGAPKAKVGPAGSVALQIWGNSVPANVSAVVLNVTVTNSLTGLPTGFVSVYPDTGPTPPNISSLNFSYLETRANLVTVKVGANGRVRLYNGRGNVDLIADVMGYFAGAAGPSGSRYRGVTPLRVLDTRNPADVMGGAPQPSGTILVTPPFGPPLPPPTPPPPAWLPAGATAVVLNVTVTNPTDAGALTVYGDGTRPATSNLNFGRGQTVPNLVVVPITGRRMFFYLKLNSLFGSAHIVADYVGFFAVDHATSAGRFVALDPFRAIDTRNPGFGALGPDEDQLLNTNGAPGGVPATGVDSVLMNVTVTLPTAAGFLTVYPPDAGTVPLASNLNFRPGMTVPNLVLAKVSSPSFFLDSDVNGTGWIAFHNGPGSSHVIVDVGGYFTN